MKKIILLLLTAITCFSQKKQEDEIYNNADDVPVSYNYSISNQKIITWTKIYDKDDTNVFEILKGNLALIILNDSTGYANNLKLRAKGISIYANSNFSIKFKIFLKKDKYRIVVSNIVFDSKLQFDLEGIKTSNKFVTLEEMELRNRDNLFRKNNQSLRNLEAINQFLTNLFDYKQISNALEDKW